MTKERKTAEALGITGKQLRDVFAYAAQKYTSPKQKKPLNGIAREVLEVLIAEEHTTMREYEEHRRTLAGRSPATITRSITTLKERGVPVQREQVIDDKGIDPIKYTRYYLTAEFKNQLFKEAAEWAEARDNSPARPKRRHRVPRKLNRS